jgi:hypothetical protein
MATELDVNGGDVNGEGVEWRCSQSDANLSPTPKQRKFQGKSWSCTSTSVKARMSSAKLDKAKIVDPSKQGIISEYAPGTFWNIVGGRPTKFAFHSQSTLESIYPHTS